MKMKKLMPTVALRNRQSLKQTLSFTAVLDQTVFIKQAGDVVKLHLERSWLSENFRNC